MVPPNQSGLNHAVDWGRDRLTVCNVGVRSGYSAKRRRPVLVVLGRHWGPTMHLPRFLLLALLTLRTASAVAQHDIVREEVAFQSGPLRLAGTLYLPSGPGRGPAVVLIHGSGAADRTTLRYYAELFARNGVAALAYDKRGVGKSEGAPLAWRNFSRHRVRLTHDDRRGQPVRASGSAAL